MKNEKTNIAILPADHWEKIAKERSMDFYECAMYFLGKNDILEVIQTLERISLDDPEKNDKIIKTTAALKDIWHKHHCHLQDIEEIKSKKAKN